MKQIPCFRASELLRQVPRQDCHVHSTFSDGKASWLAMVEQAEKISLEQITFTDHVNQTSTWVPDYVQTLRQAQSEGRCGENVFLSAEVKAADVSGTPDIAGEYLELLDFLVGVIHRYPKAGGGFHVFKEMTAEQAQEIDYAVSRKLIMHPQVDVIGHLGGTYSHYFGEYAPGLLEDLVDLAVACEKVVEINSNLRYRHQFDRILRRCIAADALITLGSDAHSIEELGGCVAAVQERLAAWAMEGTNVRAKG